MSVQEIKAAIENRSEKEILELGDWLIERHNQLWDAQIERDAIDGRFDSLIRKVKEQNSQGLTRLL